MFGKSITLFRLFGFAVKVDASWLLLAVLLTWTLAQGVFPFWYEDFSESTYWWMGLGGTLGLFISIVFHELSHSLVARKYGLPMKGITLFIFGGVAQMDEEPQNARTEFLMAIAGPVASIVMGLGFLGLSQLVSEPSGPAPFTAVVTYLGFINLVLAGFNLLPAFPLDGGRILRSGLWHWNGDLRSATKIASMIGSGFGFAMILLGLIFFLMGNLVGGVWWFLIGLFLRMASRSSFQQLIIRQSLEGESVENFMESDPVTVSPDISLQSLVQDYVYRHHHKMFPVVSEGNLKGCVTTREIKKVSQDQWNTQKVSDVMSQCDKQNTISPESDAMDALSRMNRHQISRLIVSKDNQLVGIVALKDLLRFLSLKMDLEESISVGTPLSAER